MISGAGGDAGYYSEVAEDTADAFTSTSNTSVRTLGLLPQRNVAVSLKLF